MQGIFPTDVFIKKLLETILEDIKKNLWLIDYIMDDFVSNPFLRTQYGKKQIAAAKDWFVNNNVNVYHQYIKDKEKFPALILTLGSSTESQENRGLGDVGPENLTILPNQTGDPIPYVLPPFIPTSYVSSTGLVGVPVGTDLGPISKGMVLINPTTGNGTVILGIMDGQIQIGTDIELDSSQLAVIPQYRFFTTRLGRTFFQETWNITVATNDVQSLLWLHTIVIFGLLRYREFMEHNGILEITNLSSTDIFNSEFSNPEGEEIFCRQITIQNKVEQQFIRGLHRNIESVLLRDQNPGTVTLENPSGFTGGIKIVSNENTPALNQNDTDWFTVTEENEE